MIQICDEDQRPPILKLAKVKMVKLKGYSAPVVCPVNEVESRASWKLIRLSANKDRVLVVVNIIVLLAFLPEVYLIIDGLPLFHVEEGLYQLLEKTQMV